MLLRIPLFHKLVIANAAVLAVVAAITVLLTVRATGNGEMPLVTGLIVITVGILLSLTVNALIVWFALVPLRQLEETAAKVSAGNFDVRASPSSIADPELERLVKTFNDVLDTAADRSLRLREMAARVNAAAEEERRRVAGELHDGIAQSLAALNLRVRLARSAGDPQVRQMALDEISGGISDAILELRRMARGLRPPALEMLGLAAAMSSHARSVGEAAGLVTDFDADNVSGLLTPDAELSLYRIFQESLSNVVRHSGASRVSVQLKRRDNFVELSVIDDGQGFDASGAVGARRGLGLFGMEERAAFMGGTVTIRSTKGQGTSVFVSVPIQEGSFNV
jgi:signal transduction histidine kinase